MRPQAETTSKLSEEDELQEELGFPSVEVTYTMSPIRRTNTHVGHLGLLKGMVDDSWSFIYCDCGWCMAFTKEVTMKEAEEQFVGHVQPGFE